MQATVEVWIDAPPERVYDVATDLDGVGSWMNGLVRIEKLTDGPYAVGTRWREVRQMFGREAAEEFEVKACQRPTGFELYVDGAKGTTGRGEYHFAHRFLAEGSGTKLHLAMRIEGMGLMGRFLGPIMIRSFKKAIRKDLQAMKIHIEASSA
jgi:uncharacterized protein YndB with AHSA1/START domain